MSTPDLVNLANYLSLTKDKSPNKKFLIFNSSKWMFLNKTKSLLVSAIIAKSRTMEDTVANLCALGGFIL